jgi:hypothetical protein
VTGKSGFDPRAILCVFLEDTIIDVGDDRTWNLSSMILVGAN